MLRHVWNLRSRRCFTAIATTLSRFRDREGFRIVHFSVQGNHLHLVVETHDEVRLARGLQGFAVWMARRLNAVMRRRGKVFADRYHAHQLRVEA
jgi:putative transposase